MPEPIGPTGGPDSAEPKAILKDLQQLAIVAQKLGIDLQRTAASGQAVAGQRGTGNTSETHRASLPGAGTGYQNLAQGTIAGSVMARAGFTHWTSKLADDYRKWKAAGFPGDDISAQRHRLKHGIGGQQIRIALGMDDPGPGGPTPPKSGSLKPNTNVNKPAEWMTGKQTDFGVKGMRRMIRSVTTTQGLFSIGSALLGDLQEGETRTSKVTEAAIGIAKFGVQAEVAGTVHAMKEAYSASRALGASRSLSAGRAIGMARSAFAPLAAVTAAVFVAETAAALDKVEEEADKNLANLKRGWSGKAMRPKGNRADEWKEFRISNEGLNKFGMAIEEARYNYYFDQQTGERKERSAFGKKWGRQAFVRLWGAAEEQEKEMRWRMNEAKKAHESAVKKAEVMDWEGAIKETQKAREMIVAEEAMPFFWKQPEKFLRAMESSRIAGRNWARSQQPRGASRTGD